MRFRYVKVSWGIHSEPIEGASEVRPLVLRASFTTAYTFNRIHYKGYFNSNATVTEAPIGFALFREPYLVLDRATIATAMLNVYYAPGPSGAQPFIIPTGGTLNVHGCAGTYQLLLYCTGNVDSAYFNLLPTVFLLECED